MLDTILSSFAVVATSEIGDKTQLLAFSLAARFKRAIPIMFGIFTATILNHALASTVGQWAAAKISEQTLSITLAILFLAFGLWTLKPDKFDDRKSEPKYGAYLTTTILFFLAEMGDKTQFATVALAAKYHSVVEVTIGTTLGMLVTDGLAVFLGDRLASKVQTKWIRYTAAGLFFIFAALSLANALRISAA